ncbi:septum formation family protein [Frankia sp. Mgl5]|uniref:septum formation family protein n=1 Tax=Frankia sp. Mgl5 TaxID=2933793 RepID=UPI00200D44A8|nr:septum formation family protein [Frankia sp. Mgl5]MCK9930392.1 septum formation family protein [Frankia sp. Mgl5]
MPGDSAPPAPKNDDSDNRSSDGGDRRKNDIDQPDPFAGLVLDESFVAGATRYEAPARTRAAIARFGPVEDGRTAWRPHPRARRSRLRSTRPFPDAAPRTGSRGRIVLALISLVLLGSVVYPFVMSKINDAPPTTVSADAPGSAPGDPAGGPDAYDDHSPDLRRWDWKSGRCYSWPQVNTDVPVDDVPCAEPHLFEAVGPLDLSPAYPRDAPYPSGSQWDDIGARHCGPPADQYLGHPVDPFGRYAASTIHPQRPEWETGDRDVVCGLIIRSDAPRDTPWLMSTFSGGVRGADQAMTYQPGTCFRDAADDSQEQVSCQEPHHAQTVGTITLPDTADGAPPSSEVLEDLVEAACAPQVAPYRTQGVDGATVQTGWHLIRPESWNAGTRSTTCTVSLVDQAGNRLETTGPLSPTDHSGTFTT